MRPGCFTVLMALLVTLAPVAAEARTLKGNGRANTLRGTNGKDRLFGRSGNDRLSGRRGNDRLDGGRGNDRLDGGSGRDSLIGGPGRDRLRGGPGRDRLNCGRGRDTAIVGAGDRTSGNCERVVRPGGGPGGSGGSPWEAILIESGGLWWENDSDNDGVCYLYQFRIGDGVRRVVRTAFYVNPFTGQCNRFTTTPNFGGSTQTGLGAVWGVSGNLLTVQFASGYREFIGLSSYTRATDALVVVRPTGVHVWWGCASVNNPYPCVTGAAARASAAAHPTGRPPKRAKTRPR